MINRALIILLAVNATFNYGYMARPWLGLLDDAFNHSTGERVGIITIIIKALSNLYEATFVTWDKDT